MKLNPNIWHLYFHIAQKEMLMIQDFFDDPTLQARKIPRRHSNILVLDKLRMLSHLSQGKGKISLNLLALAVQVDKNGQPYMVEQICLSVGFLVLFFEYLNRRDCLRFWLLTASSGSRYQDFLPLNRERDRKRDATYVDLVSELSRITPIHKAGNCTLCLRVLSLFDLISEISK